MLSLSRQTLVLSTQFDLSNYQGKVVMLDLWVSWCVPCRRSFPFVLSDGQRYGHIPDPTTGLPIQNSPRSITVAADTCTQAGMLATLAMLQGSRAESFLRGEGVRFWSSR